MEMEMGMTRATILLVDDDRYTRDLFVGLLRDKPVELVVAVDGAQAMQKFQAGDFNLVLMDQRLPDANGLDLLHTMRRERPRQIAILITGYADVRDAVRAVRDGLFDYLSKPFEDLEALETDIDKALELDRAYREIEDLRSSLHGDRPGPLFVGSSAPIERLLQQVQQVAALDITVLLDGDSGTGKDLLAHMLHNASPRGDGPFLELNCGAMPETLLESTLFGFQRGAFTGADRNTPGYFERADGGTLFLDEIADMSTKLQSTLLSVLQQRRFVRIGSTESRHSDFRLICATNRRLLDEVDAGRFREDLFYRINVVELRLPPLRERREDILVLALHFIDRYNQRFGKQVGPFTPDAIRLMEQAPWPGNVRQLQHLIERVVALHEAGPVSGADLEPCLGGRDDCPGGRPGARSASASGSPPAPAPLRSYREERESFERDYLQRLLRDAAGNVSEAARLSGIARQNLYVRMKRFGIDSGS